MGPVPLVSAAGLGLINECAILGLLIITVATLEVRK